MAFRCLSRVDACTPDAAALSFAQPRPAGAGGDGDGEGDGRRWDGVGTLFTHRMMSFAVMAPTELASTL